MRLIYIMLSVSLIVLLIPVSGYSKSLTPELFLEIETEILDSDMKEHSINRIIRKHGVTVNQYNRYKKKIEREPRLKAKLGKLRMKMYSDLYSE